MLLRKKEDIEKWLNQHNVKNYKLIEDQEYGYIVNVNDNVALGYLGLKNIKVKFNKIKGHFNCENNELTSLEGCPEIVGGDFNCSSNSLTTLKFGPKIVMKSYYCYFNELISLKGCSKIIEYSFDCSMNHLKRFEHNFNKVINFNCEFNKLESLEGGPKIVNGFFNLSNNLFDIKTLEHLPKKINTNQIYIFDNEKLGDLQNISNFNELKEKIEEIFKIKKEKNKLLNNIKRNNLIKNKITKI